MHVHTHTDIYIYTDVHTVSMYVQYVYIWTVQIHVIIYNLGIDTIVILFMRARSVLTIEMKCLLLCGIFTLEILPFCKSTTHTVVLLWLMQ